MESGRHGDASSSLAECRRQLAEARRQLNAEADRKKKAEARRRAQWQLNLQTQRVALILYDLAGYSNKAAVAFLNKTAAKRKWEARPLAEVSDQVGELFLQADLAEYAGLVDVANPTDQDAMRVALRFWEEWSLTEWTKQANQDKGVAPRADSLLQRLEERRQRLPEAVQPPAKGSVSEPRARMRLTRWRRRWGGKHGAIRARDDLPVEEMRGKAPVANCCFFSWLKGDEEPEPA